MALYASGPLGALQPLLELIPGYPSISRDMAGCRFSRWIVIFNSSFSGKNFSRLRVTRTRKRSKYRNFSAGPRISSGCNCTSDDLGGGRWTLRLVVPATACRLGCGNIAQAVPELELWWSIKLQRAIWCKCPAKKIRKINLRHLNLKIKRLQLERQD